MAYSDLIGDREQTPTLDQHAKPDVAPVPDHTRELEPPDWEHVDAMLGKLEGKEPGQKKAEVAAGVPAGRFATPEDLTGMAVFLASKEADYILAQTYNVDGGQWMS